MIRWMQCLRTTGLKSSPVPRSITGTILRYKRRAGSSRHPRLNGPEKNPGQENKLSSFTIGRATQVFGLLFGTKQLFRISLLQYLSGIQTSNSTIIFLLTDGLKYKKNKGWGGGKKKTPRVGPKIDFYFIGSSRFQNDSYRDSQKGVVRCTQ